MNERIAFEAMRLFLDGYYQRTNSADVAGTLSDTKMLADGETAD